MLSRFLSDAVLGRMVALVKKGGDTTTFRMLFSVFEKC